MCREKCHPPFSISMSSARSSNPETCCLSWGILLLITWYLYLHFSISHWRSFPAVWMWSCILLHRWSPRVNTTMVWRHTPSVRISMRFCRTAFSEWLKYSKGMTRSSMWGPGSHSDRALNNSSFSCLGTRFSFVPHPQASTSISCRPSDSPCATALSPPPHVLNASLPRIVLPTELFPVRFCPTISNRRAGATWPLPVGRRVLVGKLDLDFLKCWIANRAQIAFKKGNLQLFFLQWLTNISF